MRLKIRHIIMLGLMLATAATAAARTARDFFTTAPDGVFRLLPAATRLDMGDYFDFGSTNASANAMNGEAQMKAVSERVVSFRADEGVDMELAVIPTKTDTLICVITTLSLPAKDSSIEFYDKNWNKLAKPPFAMPPYAGWLTPEGVAARSEIALYLPFMPVSAAFDPEGTTLLLTNEAPYYLEDGEFEKWKPCIITSKIYDVADGSFMPK